MASARIERVNIRGFRSLEDVGISGLPDATVLIGPNGSGKSNFIRFFELLGWMLRSGRLGEFVARQGGADDQLHGGSSVTPQMTVEIGMRTERGRYDYRFSLACADHDRFMFTEEALRPSDGELPPDSSWQHLGSGHLEARILEAAQSSDDCGVNSVAARSIVNLLRSCAVFQFHDTSSGAGFRNSWDVSGGDLLRGHGGNLPAVLHRLEQEDLPRYETICRHIARVVPGFERFAIEEDCGRVLLRWKAGWTNKTIGPHVTSDGSLRFFALVTLLNLPSAMLPAILLLDEPELGLHPAAVALIGGMIKSISQERQVIVATQSPLLVDAFDIGEIVVAELRGGRTDLRTLDPDGYRLWVDDGFTHGQLWQKNLLGGRP